GTTIRGYGRIRGSAQLGQILKEHEFSEVVAHRGLHPCISRRQRAVAFLSRARERLVFGRGALPLRAPVTPLLDPLRGADEIVVVDPLRNEAWRPVRNC